MQQRPEECKLVNDHQLEFDIVCPNNHNQSVAFRNKEFEEALKSGALVFHCNTCEADWSPSRDEINHFRKGFKVLDKSPVQNG